MMEKITKSTFKQMKITYVSTWVLNEERVRMKGGYYRELAILLVSQLYTSKISHRMIVHDSP